MPTMTEEQMRALARQSAAQYGLDPTWFEAQLDQESRYNPDAVSAAGAIGVAQFMPKTAKGRGVKNPRDPAEAIPAAAAYMSELKQRFGDENLARLAYNWGQGNVAKYLKSPDTVALPKEAASYNAAVAKRAGLSPQYPEPVSVREAAVPKGKLQPDMALALQEVSTGLPPGALLAPTPPPPPPVAEAPAAPQDWMQFLSNLTASAPAMSSAQPAEDMLSQLQGQASMDQDRVLANAFGDTALPDLPGLGNVPAAVDRYLDRLLAG